MEEQLILANLKLINKVIIDMHLYWNTDDEYQNYYDAGLEGLIKGAKAFDESKGYTKATYLYKCIKNMICREIQYSETNKRKIQKEVIISLDATINTTEGEKTYLDYMPDPNINIELDAIRNEEKQKLKTAIDELFSQRNKILFCKYYGLFGYKKYGTSELIKEYKITRSRINYIKRRCIDKLRKYYKEVNK